VSDLIREIGDLGGDHWLGRTIAIIAAGVGILVGWVIVALCVFLMVRGFIVGDPVGSDDPYVEHPVRP
jgi:hypothetical protein